MRVQHSRRALNAGGKEMERKFKEITFNGVLNCGAFIYGASVTVPEDYRMSELVRAIKQAGYKQFMLDGMKTLANVI